MESIRIARLTEENLPDYFDKQWEYLCRDLFSEADTPEDRAYFASTEYRNEVRRRLKNGTLLLLSYRTAGDAVGYAQIALEGGSARVMEYWMLPAYRRRGLGKSCWQATEAGLCALGIAFITLEAATREAKTFWKRMGFANPKQEIMQKSLKNAGKDCENQV